jgi:Holliday junction resolvasome RuvABC ATP-dependent DNA helicase subunit
MFGNTENTLWTEKYRPSKLDDYIGNDHIKEKVKIYLENQDVPHLLLAGPAGTGKCLDYGEKITIRMNLTDDEKELLKSYIM